MTGFYGISHTWNLRFKLTSSFSVNKVFKLILYVIAEMSKILFITGGHKLYYYYDYRGN